MNVDFFNKTIPRPSVSTVCSGCSASRNGSNFSASISAGISNCPQGCSYSWSVSGSASGSCPSGTVSAGGSASPSCNISGTVANSSTSTGSVSITVINTESPSYSDSDSESYNWENRTPDDPFRNVNAGCFVDTINDDSISSGSCFGSGKRHSTQRANIVFSVGDMVGRDTYYFSRGASVVWSGGCTGSGSQCAVYGSCGYQGCPSLGTVVATATVTLEGQTKEFRITGTDNTEWEGGVIEN